MEINMNRRTLLKGMLSGIGLAMVPIGTMKALDHVNVPHFPRTYHFPIAGHFPAPTEFSPFASLFAYLGEYDGLPVFARKWVTFITYTSSIDVVSAISFQYPGQSQYEGMELSLDQIGSFYTARPFEEQGKSVFGVTNKVYKSGNTYVTEYNYEANEKTQQFQQVLLGKEKPFIQGIGTYLGNTVYDSRITGIFLDPRLPLKQQYGVLAHSDTASFFPELLNMLPTKSVQPDSLYYFASRNGFLHSRKILPEIDPLYDFPTEQQGYVYSKDGLFKNLLPDLILHNYSWPLVYPEIEEWK